MNSTLRLATLVLGATAVAFIWGVHYRSEHQMAAVGALFGAVDNTYEIAGWACDIGALGFLVGLALLVGGVVQMGRSGPIANSTRDERPPTSNDGDGSYTM